MVHVKKSYKVTISDCKNPIYLAWITCSQLNITAILYTFQPDFFAFYIRLTPPYAYLIFFYTFLFPVLSDGPNWGNQRLEVCEKYWWTNLLYINNFYPTNILDMVSNCDCDMNHFFVKTNLPRRLAYFTLLPLKIFRKR